MSDQGSFVEVQSGSHSSPSSRGTSVSGLTLIHRGKIYSVASISEAQDIYSALRDASGEGFSTFQNGILRRDGKKIGFLSYNACAWSAPKVPL